MIRETLALFLTQCQSDPFLPTHHILRRTDCHRVRLSSYPAPIFLLSRAFCVSFNREMYLSYFLSLSRAFSSHINIFATTALPNIQMHTYTHRKPKNSLPMNRSIALLKPGSMALRPTYVPYVISNQNLGLWLSLT